MHIFTKRLIVTALIIILTASIVCFLPWPTRVNVQMTGMEVTADGTPVHPCTVHIKGWKLNYLFRDDTVKFDIQIIGTYGLELNGTNHTSLYPLSEEFDYATWMIYLSETNQLEIVSAYLDSDLNWLGLSVVDRFFVASTTPDSDLQAYWEKFADQIQ